MGTKDNVTPSVGALIGGVVGTGLLVGAVTGGIVATLNEPPVQSDFAVAASERASQLEVRIDDPQDVLSPEDEARIEKDAQRLEVPGVVTQLNYQVFAENHENVNDTVEEYARDSRPELISEDDDHFADGVLIVGVGLDPRQSFVFAGEDVADALFLREGANLDEAVTAIQPGVKDGNIPAGLFAGADRATDASASAQRQFAAAKENHVMSIVGGAAAGGLGTAGVATATGIGMRNRKRKALQAREDYEALTTEYAQLGNRLDSIDIRAHSLASPLADRNLRQQWETVRTRFVGLHEDVDKLSGLQRSSTDAEFRSHAATLRDAVESAESVDVAEENINTLFNLEQGDATVRHREALALRDDIREAQIKVDKTTDPLHSRFGELSTRADNLATRTDDPQFLDTFVVLLHDYQQALAVLKDKEFSGVKESTELVAPRIDDRRYRPGYGYDGFTPYWAMSAWHASNVQAAEAAQSSSSTNSSFSSGFSGAGGSSSF